MFLIELIPHERRELRLFAKLSGGYDLVLFTNTWQHLSRPRHHMREGIIKSVRGAEVFFGSD